MSFKTCLSGYCVAHLSFILQCNLTQVLFIFSIIRRTRNALFAISLLLAFSIQLMKYAKGWLRRVNNGLSGSVMIFIL
jgi:hypothetical protein